MTLSRGSAFALLMAIALRDIEAVSPTLGCVARSAVDHYNDEMGRINGARTPDLRRTARSQEDHETHATPRRPQ